LDPDLAGSGFGWIRVTRIRSGFSWIRHVRIWHGSGSGWIAKFSIRCTPVRERENKEEKTPEKKATSENRNYSETTVLE